MSPHTVRYPKWCYNVLAKFHEKQGERHVSKLVFHCTYCGCCWQKEQDTVPTVYGQSKYEDFPAYGLTKKKCLECKAKEAEDAISDAKK